MSYKLINVYKNPDDGKFYRKEDENGIPQELSSFQILPPSIRDGKAWWTLSFYYTEVRGLPINESPVIQEYPGIKLGFILDEYATWIKSNYTLEQPPESGWYYQIDKVILKVYCDEEGQWIKEFKEGRKIPLIQKELGSLPTPILLGDTKYLIGNQGDPARLLDIKDCDPIQPFEGIRLGRIKGDIADQIIPIECVKTEVLAEPNEVKKSLRPKLKPW